jgi:hypothetical protein
MTENGLFPNCKLTLISKLEAGLIDNYHSGPKPPLGMNCRNLPFNPCFYDLAMVSAPYTLRSIQDKSYNQVHPVLNCNTTSTCKVPQEYLLNLNGNIKPSTIKNINISLSPCHWSQLIYNKKSTILETFNMKLISERLESDKCYDSTQGRIAEENATTRLKVNGLKELLQRKKSKRMQRNLIFKASIM